MRYVILWTHVQKRRLSGAVFSLLFLYFKGGPSDGKRDLVAEKVVLAAEQRILPVEKVVLAAEKEILPAEKGGFSGGKKDLTGANDDFSGGNKVFPVRLFIEAQKV